MPKALEKNPELKAVFEFFTRKIGRLEEQVRELAGHLGLELPSEQEKEDDSKTKV